MYVRETRYDTRGKYMNMQNIPIYCNAVAIEGLQIMQPIDSRALRLTRTCNYRIVTRLFIVAFVIRDDM